MFPAVLEDFLFIPFMIYPKELSVFGKYPFISALVTEKKTNKLDRVWTKDAFWLIFVYVVTLVLVNLYLFHLNII